MHHDSCKLRVLLRSLNNISEFNDLVFFLAGPLFFINKKQEPATL